LQHTDNLSKTLQDPKLTVAEGAKIAHLTWSTLLKVRSEESYDLFWERLVKLQEEFEVNEAVLPRKGRITSRLDDGAAATEFHATPKAYYRQIYFKAVDLISSFILQRFDQPGLKSYQILQDLLLKAARKESYDKELKEVIEFYHSDFNEASLKVQLELFTTGYIEGKKGRTDFSEVVQYMKTLSPAMQSAMSEVVKLLTLATNAVSQRSASALRRVKHT